MPIVTGQPLLRAVAERIVAMHLVSNGMDEVELVRPWPNAMTSAGVDITWGARDIGVNVEARWLFTSEEKGSMEVRPDGVQFTAGVRCYF